MKLFSAASVVEQIRRAEFKSTEGGGAGPLLLRSALNAVEFNEVDDSFPCCNPASASIVAVSARRDGERSLSASSDGNTSFFCLLAGKISSRSTGTPRETRNSRRMGDNTQFGGWSGGGATSCAHKD